MTALIACIEHRGSYIPPSEQRRAKEIGGRFNGLQKPGERILRARRARERRDDLVRREQRLGAEHASNEQHPVVDLTHLVGTKGRRRSMVFRGQPTAATTPAPGGTR